MPSHKNQHFVPRCFFRPFSLGREGRSINLFNVDRQKSISNAPLKSQCSGDYFYGKDLTLERVLQKAEGLYAGLLERIVAPNYVLSDRDRSILRHFCFLQHSRTDAAARRAAEVPGAMIDLAFQGDPPAQWRTTFQQDVVNALRAYADTMHAVDDLRVCLIRNETTTQFVASDDPAVLTNRFYLQDPRTRGMSGGVGNAGALFFMPMTPSVLCVVYDSDTYSLANNGGWISIRNKDDVEALNEHQYLNCSANIYFSDWDMRTNVTSSFQAANHRRPELRYRMNTAVLESEQNGQKRYVVVPREDLPVDGNILVHLQLVWPTPSRWPSFLRWRWPRRIYTNGSGTGFVRLWPLQCGLVQGDGYKRVA